MTKAGGPALLFTNVRGSRLPLLINQFGTERRMCMAFGVDDLDELGRRVTDVLEMQPPEGLVDKVRALQKLKSLADSRPKTVSRGPCQEVVLDPPSLASLPVMTCWPGDGGPYITLPAVITTDPRSGTRNVGMYRVQVFDETTTAMHWQIHKDAAADWRGHGRADGRRDRARARPDHRLHGLGAAAQAHRRAHAGRLPARPAGRARAAARRSTSRCRRGPRS